MSKVYFGGTNSVASYYSELSEGRMRVTGEVFGWFTLAVSTATCDQNGWALAARTAAKAAGIDLNAFTNVAYAFPKQAACWWSGLANLPGRNSWMNGTTSLFITSHELGHNFGVHHASSMTCNSGGSRVQYSSKCSVSEYGDPFDVMGYKGQRHMTNWHRWQLGFLSQADVQTVTTHGTYRMATAQVPGGVPRVLRLARPSGDYYYLEFRQPYGDYDDFSPTAPVVNGVTVRIAPDVAWRSQSRLLDANPATSSFGDAAIPVGGTFVDPINQISISTLSVDPDGATVQIQLGPDTVPPSPPTDVSAQASAEGDVWLGWTAATDDVAIAGYRVSRGGSVLATVATTEFTDLAPPQGMTHEYSVEALDGAGNASAPAGASIYVPDTLAPAPPAPALAEAAGPRSATVSWTPSVDNVGVAGYHVYRDASLIATTDATSLVDEAASDGRLNAYEIRAFDAAGNASDPALAGLELADVSSPALSGELVASVVTPTDVALAWPAATDNVGVAGYEVARDGQVIATTESTDYSDAGLGQGDSYDYAVTAVDSAGNRSETLNASVYLPDTLAPAAPAEISAALSGANAVDLTWSPAFDNVGVDHYEVLVDGLPYATTTSLALTGVAVEQSRTYRFSVIAYDGAGNGGPAAEITLLVPDSTPPSGTTLAAAEAGPTTASLAWTAATDNIGVSGYVVLRDDVIAATLASDVMSYVDSGLASDRTYTYSVHALDASGNAGPAAMASVTLVSRDVAAPSTPTNLQGVPLDRRRVSLTWSPSTDNWPGSIRYQVFRNKRKIAVVTTTSYLDRPATKGTYRYRVRAVDAAGNKSSFSIAAWVTAVRRV